MDTADYSDCTHLKKKKTKCVERIHEKRNKKKAVPVCDLTFVSLIERKKETNGANMKTVKTLTEKASVESFRRFSKKTSHLLLLHPVLAQTLLPPSINGRL